MSIDSPMHSSRDVGIMIVVLAIKLHLCNSFASVGCASGPEPFNLETESSARGPSRSVCYCSTVAPMRSQGKPSLYRMCVGGERAPHKSAEFNLASFQLPGTHHFRARWVRPRQALPFLKGSAAASWLHSLALLPLFSLLCLGNEMHTLVDLLDSQKQTL